MGLSYNITKQDNKRKISIGITALREKEIPLDGENKTQNRLSGDFELALKVINNISINATNNYQPNLKEAGDFRWKTNISIRINLTSQFFLSINLNVFVDQLVP